MKVTILFQSFHSYQQTSSEENAQNAEKLGGGFFIEAAKFCHYQIYLDKIWRSSVQVISLQQLRQIRYKNLHALLKY